MAPPAIAFPPPPGPGGGPTQRGGEGSVDGEDTEDAEVDEAEDAEGDAEEGRLEGVLAAIAGGMPSSLDAGCFHRWAATSSSFFSALSVEETKVEAEWTLSTSSTSSSSSSALEFLGREEAEEARQRRPDDAKEGGEGGEETNG